MRRIVYACFILVIAVLVSGCSQPATIVTPTPEPSLTIMPTPLETNSLYQKRIDVTALQSGSDVIVRYDGGEDAADLVGLDISIQSYNNLQNKEERENNPVVGQRYVFPNMGTADQNTVTVAGIFRDGTRQTLLQTKV